MDRRTFIRITLATGGAAATVGGPAGAAASPDPQSTARQDLLVTPPVAVPPSGMPADVAAALREIGPVIDGARTIPLYAPLHAGKSHDTVEVRRDLAYGPDPRHRADVFTERAASDVPRPLLVFSYGGGFRGGAKSSPDTPFYDNIGYWAAANGLVGVTINYRLAPEFTWPSGAEDIARVVAWLREQAPSWGADPAQIFLWGHSSGAAHVADYLVRTPDAPVRAAILMSGIYSLGTETSMWSAYYGEDVSQYPARSSLPRLIQLPLPIMAVWAELDAPNFIPDTEGLIEGRRPNFYVSAKVAAATGDRAAYLKNRGLEKGHYKELIKLQLRQFGPLPRNEIDAFLREKISDVLDDEQKTHRIRNLLQEMRREKIIITTGKGPAALWELSTGLGKTESVDELDS